MRIAKFAATAMFSIAALCVATVTAHGDPGAVDSGISGVDRGVEYTTDLAADRSAVTTTLAAGRFEMGAGAVNVIGLNGEVIASLPLVYQVADRSLSVVPEVDAAGTTLTVRPADPAEVVVPTAESVALQNVADAGSIVTGAVIGCLVGIAIGIWFFGIGAIIGCGVGGLIGAIIGGQNP